MRRRTWAVAVSLGAAVLATGGCASSATLGAGSAPTTTAPATVATSSESPAPCDTGSPLPGGGAQIIDYIDFVRLEGTMYTALGPAHPATTKGDLREVVGTVRCRLSDINDTHAPPHARDGDAAFLAPGTAVHAVAGYPSACRVAALDENGELHVYLADAERTKVARPAACATRPTS